MIGLIMRKARNLVSGAVRRFLNNTPSNSYEKITFDALRSALVTFGKANPA